VLFSGKYYDAVEQKFADVLPSGSECKPGKKLARSRCMLVAGFFLGLLFNPEDGSSMFFQNIGEVLSHYTALHPRRSYSSRNLVCDQWCLHVFLGNNWFNYT
jgi:hypothetical protein